MEPALPRVVLIQPQSPRRDQVVEALGTLGGAQLTCVDCPSLALVDRAVAVADVVIADLEGSSLGGAHMVRALADTAPSASIVVSLPADQADRADDALRNGAAACVLRGPEEPFDTARTVAQLLAHPDAAPRGGNQDHLWVQNSLERTDLVDITGEGLYSALRASLVASRQRTCDVAILVTGDVGSIRVDRARLLRSLELCADVVRAQGNRDMITLEIGRHGARRNGAGYLRVRISDIESPRQARRLRKRPDLSGVRASAPLADAARLVSLMDGDLLLRTSRRAMRIEYVLPVLDGSAVPDPIAVPREVPVLVVHPRGPVRRCIANELRKLGADVADAATAGRAARAFCSLSERGRIPRAVLLAEALRGEARLRDRIDRVLGRNAPTLVRLARPGGDAGVVDGGTLIAPPARRSLAALLGTHPPVPGLISSPLAETSPDKAA